VKWVGVSIGFGEVGGASRMCIGKTFGYQQIIYKLCDDFTYPPKWPWWNWRE